MERFYVHLLLLGSNCRYPSSPQHPIGSGEDLANGGIRRCLVFEPMPDVAPAVRGGFIVELVEFIHGEISDALGLELFNAPVGLVVFERVRQGMAKHDMPHLMHECFLWMYRHRIESNLHALRVPLQVPIRALKRHTTDTQLIEHVLSAPAWYLAWGQLRTFSIR